MNKQVAYFDFLMNHQQILAFALSALCVTGIFNVNLWIVQHLTDCVIIPIPGYKYDAVAAGLNIQQRKLQK